jgi:hypothetical protein
MAATPASGAAAAHIVQQPVPAASESSMLQTPSTAAATVSSVLDRFLAREPVQQRYAESESAFTAASDALLAARSALTKLQSVCLKNSPAVQLPSSMQLKLAQRAHFPDVAGKPHFYASFTAALEDIDREASAKAATIVMDAHRALIAHCESQANALSFTDRHVQDYKQFVSTFATDYDRQMGSAAASASSASDVAVYAFPAQAAVDHFTRFLQNAISDHAMSSVEQAQQRQALQAQRAAAEHNAQETVIAGATTGATIVMLVDQKLAPLQKQLLSVQKRISSDHSKPLQQQHNSQKPPKQQTRPSDTAAPTRHVTFNLGKKSHRSAGSKRARSPGRQQDSDRNSASSPRNAGHTANNRRDSSAPQKNVQGGDRRRSHQASNRAGHQGGERRKGNQNNRRNDQQL